MAEERHTFLQKRASGAKWEKHPFVKMYLYEVSEL